MALFIRWRLVIAFAGCIILLASGAVICSQPSDVGSSHPMAAAQSTIQPAQEISLSGQPFIAVAKQANAAVVKISSVKKGRRVAERVSTLCFDDPFFRRFTAKSLNDETLPSVSARSKGLAPA